MQSLDTNHIAPAWVLAGMHTSVAVAKHATNLQAATYVNIAGVQS
jgi:hypothetical protein